MTACTRSQPCGRCRDQREPGAAAVPVPIAPGSVGAWMIDGWWQANPPARWWGRGLSSEVGVRVMGELRRPLS